MSTSNRRRLRNGFIVPVIILFYTTGLGPLTDGCLDNAERSFGAPPVRMLLVSSALRDAEVLADAAAVNVLVVRYDAGAATLESLLGDARRALAGRKAASIGIAAHDFGEAKFYLCRGETVGLETTLSSAAQRAFWRGLASLLEPGGRIDLFACDLAADTRGRLLVASLEEMTGADFAASNDKTGGAPRGDWLLETDDVDLEHTYFSGERLSAFSGLLAAQVKKLVAADPDYMDCFGRSVAIDGDYAIVGASNDDEAGSDAGAAYVFYRNQGGTNNWGQVAKLLGSDTDADDWFGASVSLCGNFALVGADQNENGGNDNGSAYVFERTGSPGNWNEIAKIVPLNIVEADTFGCSVSMYGDIAVVADDDANVVGLGLDAGTVDIFYRNQGGPNNWGHVKHLLSIYGDDNFGTSVSLVGDTLIVGARHDSSTGPSSGAAYIFRKDFGGADNWGQVNKLTASDAEEGDMFGMSVDISGDYAAVGNNMKDGNIGAAYVYYRNEGGADNWGEIKKLSASDPWAYSSFGIAIAISGGNVVVGALHDYDDSSGGGVAYLFSQNHGGADNWGLVDKFQSEDPPGADYFGCAADIQGAEIIIGAYGHSVGGEIYAGAAYIFNGSGPSLSDPTYSAVSYFSATLGAMVDNDGGSPLSERGVVWSTTNHKPTLADNEGSASSAGGGTGAFMLDATGLSAGTDYYFRGYAVNAFGTAYSGTSAFSTLQASPPSLGTNYVLTDSCSSVKVFCLMWSTGTPPANQHGHVWNNSGNPTLNDNKTELGTASYGSFYSTLTGLSPDVTYYVRAYATNVVGTVYNEETTFVYYIITSSAGPNGGITSLGEIPLIGGSSRYFYIDPDINYYIEDVVINHGETSVLGDLVDLGNGRWYYPFTNIAASNTIHATFARYSGTLNVNIDQGGSGGSFSIAGPEDFTPVTGQTSNFSASAPTGTYTVTFSEQTGYTLALNATTFAVAGSAASGELDTGATETVTGAYTIITYTISVTQGADGTIAPGTTVVNHGAGQAFTVTPAAGYHVASILVDGEPIDLENDPNLTNNGDCSYTYTFGNVTADHSITAAYARSSGCLHVQLEQGGSAGSFSITGPEDFTPVTGRTTNFDEDVPSGDYTVTFTQEAGYALALTATTFTVTDNVAAGTLYPWGGEEVTGTYTRLSGRLNVDITSGGSSGSFSIEGPEDFNGGLPLTGQTANYGATAPTGDYTVTFTQEAGYALAVTATTFTVTDNVAAGTLDVEATETVTGAYEALLGSLQVNIEPEGARNAGARWRRDGGDWHASGFTEADIPAGTVTVEFASVYGWLAPAGVEQVITPGQTTVHTATYTPVGNLQVLITPAEAVSDGAQWRRVGATGWRNAGEWERDLPAGNYEIEFRDLDGWYEPLNRHVELEAGDEKVLEVEYSRVAGSLTVVIVPEWAEMAGAAWRFQGEGQWRPPSAEDAPPADARPSPFSATADKSKGGAGGGFAQSLCSQGLAQPTDLQLAPGSARWVPAGRPYVSVGNDGGFLNSTEVSYSADVPSAANENLPCPLFSKEGNAYPPSAETAQPSSTIQLAPGAYTLEFLPAPGWYCPPLDVEVRAGEETCVVGRYLPFLVADASDYDGDGLPDAATFGPTDGKWRVKDLFERRYGRKGDFPAPGDYDGDGLADLAFFRPAGGHWFVRGGSKVEGLGREGDVPVPADYDGDGRTDPALYRPSTGEWIIALPPSKLKDSIAAAPSNGGTLSLRACPPWRERDEVRASAQSGFSGNPHLAFGHPPPQGEGRSEDKVTVMIWGGGRHEVPVPGDYFGKGRAEPAVFDLESGQWSFSGGEKAVKFGRAGEAPVPADYDGDGRTDIAVVDFDAGLSPWRVLGQFTAFFKHSPDCFPVMVDSDGDGLLSYGAFDPRDGSWVLIGNPDRAKNFDEAAAQRLKHGRKGDVPLARGR